MWRGWRCGRGLEADTTENTAANVSRTWTLEVSVKRLQTSRTTFDICVRKLWTITDALSTHIQITSSNNNHSLPLPFSSSPHLPQPPDHAFRLIFFSCLFCPFSLSLSKNFLCSSALNPFNLVSRISLFFFSASNLLSSAFSPSSAFLSLRVSSSRVCRILHVTSVRKWAVVTRVSGRRRKCWKRGRVGA